MTLYIIEVEGRAVMAFPAEDEFKAYQFAESEATEEDLVVLHHNEAPIWDGESDLFVREAHAEEQAKWETAFAHALQSSNADPMDRDQWVAFLIPVTDPTDLDDDLDEDDDGDDDDDEDEDEDEEDEDSDKNEGD